LKNFTKKSSLETSKTQIVETFAEKFLIENLCIFKNYFALENNGAFKNF